jgi:hypothetical protein
MSIIVLTAVAHLLFIERWHWYVVSTRALQQFEHQLRALSEN